MFEIAYTFRGSILFSFSTANIVTLEEKFKKWGSFFALSTDDMGFNSFFHH